MPTIQVEEDDEVIIVEFAPVPGVRSVSLSPKDVIEKSQEAIDDALKKMRGMAKKTAKAIKKIPVTEKPNTISISFGFKLTAEGGVVLAKAGLEAGFNVTMAWQDIITFYEIQTQMTENVRLQNLRDFTVQIRDANDQIIGTGIAVSTDGKIVTCAHVVEAAIGVHPRNANGTEVSVYFPQVRGGEEKKRKATVEKFFPKNDDDIVLLNLSDGPSPLAPEQIPKLGIAQESAGHPFKSFGYRRLSNYQGLPADGHIVDYIEKPEDKILLWEPVMLDSQHIDSGMSGSGVLDITRNLIVGIVYETYDSAGWQKDRDTAFAVDTRVLSFDPFDLKFEDEPFPLRPAPEPKTDEQTKQQVLQVAQVTVAQRSIEEKYSWNNAPSVLTEWTGRDDLLKQITEDWNNPQKHVTGLIGFGGEGKSSLARKWVETLEQPALSSSKGSNVKTFDGLFWWGFYENRSVDEFLESALNYMSGGRIDPRQIQSSNLRAPIIGAMLGTGRYLFVLDGLEVMQHQEGDQYGLLQSNDLRDLLTFFARPDNQSFCLITSRAPVLDLMDYTTYTHRDVEQLSEEDGQALLQRLGVKGSDAELNKVVSDWDGHALTLSILAAYLAERYQGDIKHLSNIPIPTAAEPRYERVHRVLRRYDEHLTKDEREFLKLFSVFRLPVQESAFEKVFEPWLKQKGVMARLFGSKTDSRISNIVNRLVTYRLIRHDENENSYTTHPLIRNHYFALFTKGDPSQGKAAHQQIKDYYLLIAGDTPEYPTLDDLKPLIEVVHHACQAGAYDEAFRINRERIRQSSRNVLVYHLGAFETQLALMQGFFPNSDFAKDPSLADAGTKRWTLNEIGICLMFLGRLREAVPFYERMKKIALEMQDWHNLNIGYRNLVELHAQLGDLEASAEAAHQALDLARHAENKQDEYYTLARQARATFLLGDLESADSAFQQAEILGKESMTINYLHGHFGSFHVDHLRRLVKSDYARRVAESNLELCSRNHWQYLVSQCNRVIGDLDSDAGDHESARTHYESALKIARGIQKHDVLIEALLARGRWQAKPMKDANAAFSDLNEALGYCVESGYRIYEADVRVALAWAYLADLTPASPERRGETLKKAKESAERALQMSNEMGYQWGKVDAKEVLERIESGE